VQLSKKSLSEITMHCIIVIITNEYYNSAVDSKKLQEHLTTENKKQKNDSVTQVKNRSQTVRDQTSG